MGREITLMNDYNVYMIYDNSCHFVHNDALPGNTHIARFRVLDHVITFLKSTYSLNYIRNNIVVIEIIENKKDVFKYKLDLFPVTLGEILNSALNEKRDLLQ